MRFSGVIFVIFNFISLAFAATFEVVVGSNGANSYDPPFVTGVQSGDTLHFQFTSSVAHTVTESTFDEPCVTRSGGRGSGVLSAGSDWTTVISDASSPIWFYCDVASHCSASGMVFAVNPTTEQSWEAFQAKAIGRSLPSTSRRASGSISASVPVSRSRSASTTSTSGSVGSANSGITSTTTASVTTPSATGAATTSSEAKISVQKFLGVVMVGVAILIGLAV